MSVLRTLSAFGAALVSTVTAPSDAAPPADPRMVRGLLAELGLIRPNASFEQTDRALRAFQNHLGLEPDGVAGPQTVQELSRYAREARQLRDAGLAA
jgi:murein L,D-transpeptidase YcbB/YkuD